MSAGCTTTEVPQNPAVSLTATPTTEPQAQATAVPGALAPGEYAAFGTGAGTGKITIVRYAL